MIGWGLVVILMAAVNVFRGGGLWADKFADKIPGHPRIYASVAAGLIALTVAGPITAACVSLGYFFWALLPWGGWFDLGRVHDTWPMTKRTAFENRLTNLCRGNDHLAFTVRNLIGSGVVATLVSPWFLLLAPLQTVSYEIGWRVSSASAIRIGEALTGIVWGILVVAFA